MKPIFFEVANQFAIESWSTVNLQIRSIIRSYVNLRCFVLFFPHSYKIHYTCSYKATSIYGVLYCFSHTQIRSIILALTSISGVLYCFSYTQGMQHNASFASKLNNENNKGHKEPALPTLAITSCQSHSGKQQFV